jgi:hypothetical protein
VVDAAQAAAGRRLGAVLLNPPTGGGRPTLRHLAVAADLLDCESVRVANLYSRATPSVTELNLDGRDWAGWQAARSDLTALVADADEVLFAWGVSGLSGVVARHRAAQTDWLLDSFHAAGRAEIWTVGGEPRHPSRWHQYVSDRHGRASGDTFSDRLRMVLVRTAITNPQGSSTDQKLSVTAVTFPTTALAKGLGHQDLGRLGTNRRNRS